MKLNTPNEYRRTHTAVLEAKDFPKRELIEPRLAKLGFELTDTYEGTSESPFLVEALTLSPATILRALSLKHFEFEIPTALAFQKDRAAFGARFGFKDLAAWAGFCRTTALYLPKASESDQRAYAAYLFALVGESRSLSLQLNGIMGQLLALKKSPILSRGQVEAFMRLSETMGTRIDSKKVARFLVAFTLVEALELLGSGLTETKLDQALQIRADLGYDASASELVEMLNTTNNTWITSLLGDGVHA